MLALWHITFVEKGLQAVLRPKTPDYSAPGENVEINRISLIKQFFNEYKVSSNDIFLEPLNKESEKFWKKLGIKCSLY